MWSEEKILVVFLLRCDIKSNYLSMYLPIYLPTYLTIYLPTCIYLYRHLHTSKFIHLLSGETKEALLLPPNWQDNLAQVKENLGEAPRNLK